MRSSSSSYSSSYSSSTQDIKIYSPRSKLFAETIAMHSIRFIHKASPVNEDTSSTEQDDEKRITNETFISSSEKNFNLLSPYISPHNTNQKYHFVGPSVVFTRDKIIKAMSEQTYHLLEQNPNHEQMIDPSDLSPQDFNQYVSDILVKEYGHQRVFIDYNFSFDNERLENSLSESESTTSNSSSSGKLFESSVPYTASAVDYYHSYQKNSSFVPDIVTKKAHIIERSNRHQKYLLQEDSSASEQMIDPVDLSPQDFNRHVSDILVKKPGYQRVFPHGFFYDNQFSQGNTSGKVENFQRNKMKVTLTLECFTHQKTKDDSSVDYDLYTHSDNTNYTLFVEPLKISFTKSWKNNDELISHTKNQTNKMNKFHSCIKEISAAISQSLKGKNIADIIEDWIDDIVEQYKDEMDDDIGNEITLFYFSNYNAHDHMFTAEIRCNNSNKVYVLKTSVQISLSCFGEKNNLKKSFSSLSDFLNEYFSSDASQKILKSVNKQVIKFDKKLIKNKKKYIDGSLQNVLEDLQKMHTKTHRKKF